MVSKLTLASLLLLQALIYCLASPMPKALFGIGAPPPPPPIPGSPLLGPVRFGLNGLGGPPPPPVGPPGIGPGLGLGFPGPQAGLGRVPPIGLYSGVRPGLLRR